MCISVCVQVCVYECGPHTQCLLTECPARLTNICTRVICKLVPTVTFSCCSPLGLVPTDHGTDSDRAARAGVRGRGVTGHGQLGHRHWGHHGGLRVGGRVR